MRKRREWRIAAAVSCLALLMSGCWDSRDIDNRLLVGAMGLEMKSAAAIQVWLRFPLPKTSQDLARKDFFTVSQSGSTVLDALNKAKYKLPKALDISSTRAVLLHESMGKSGLEAALEFAIRERSVPLDAVVAVFRGDMNEIFMSPNPIGELSGIYTKLFFEPYAGGIPRKNKTLLWEVYAKLYNPFHANLIPVLAQDEHDKFALHGNAIFVGDKIVGELNRDESLMYEIITQRFHDSEVELMNRSDIRIVHNRSRVTTSLVDGRPVINVDASLVTTLIDTARTRKQNAAQIVADLEKNLNAHTKSMFAKTQRAGADIFGFGNRFRSRLKPSQYDNWSDMFRTAKITYRYHVELRNTGLEFLD